jgi:hypothetical protein
MHDVVDIAYWKTMFPLSALREEAREFVLARQRSQREAYPDQAAIERHIALMEPGGTAITSPHDIAVIEQLREEALVGRPSPKRVSMDVFVFGLGEPVRREVTKVGGLPYWPAERKWPRTRDGRPRTFLAQFCFADSRDIVGDLPAEVLVIFDDEEVSGGHGEEDAFGLSFEWMNLGQSNLVSAEDIPQRNHKITPCYGTRHRTWDYLGTGDLFQRYHAPWQIDMVEGTKIGGMPRWIQHPERLPGRFLCALGSIQPVWQRPFPYVNVAEPLDPYDEETLMWGDAGSLYLFIDERGQVRCTMQYY